MNTEHLIEFVRLAQKQSYHAAARELHLSTAALSKHVKALEFELGYELLERGGGHVSLTEDGSRFLRLAREMIDLYDRALGIREDSEGRRLAIGLPLLREDYASYRRLREVLIGFRAAHPDIDVSLKLVDEASASTLLEEDVDCVLDIWAQKADWDPYSEDVSLFEVGKGSIAARIPRNHPLYGETVVSLSDLGSCRIAIPSSPHLACLATVVKRIFSRYDDVRFVYKPGDTVDSFRLSLSSSEPVICVVPRPTVEIDGFSLASIFDCSYVDVLAVPREPRCLEAAVFSRYLGERMQAL